MFHTFHKKDYVCLLGVILIGFGWLLIDQIFLSEIYQRFIALFIILVTLFFLQFKLNKPSSVWKYANTLVAICLGFIVTISLILHAFIRHDLDYRSILIWILTACLPYLVAGIYQLLQKDKL
jgi:hypothetical protein